MFCYSKTLTSNYVICMYGGRPHTPDSNGRNLFVLVAWLGREASDSRKLGGISRVCIPLSREDSAALAVARVAAMRHCRWRRHHFGGCTCELNPLRQPRIMHLYCILYLRKTPCLLHMLVAGRCTPSCRLRPHVSMSMRAI